MVEIFGKNYFINIDEILKTCKSEGKKEDVDYTSEETNDVLEINIFKYEILKYCIERVLNNVDEIVDEELPLYAQSELSTSFKLAFNTLIKYNILIEDDYE